MTRRATPLQVIVVLAISAAAGLGLARQDATAPASAEEQAVRVDLGYVRGYSNWGPTNVYGMALIWPREAVATITVHNLPHLPGGARYVWWAMNKATGAVVRLGVFNTSEAGDANQDAFIEPGLPAGADAVIVSISQGKDPMLRPGAQRTMGGNFSPDATAMPAPSPTAGNEGKATAGNGDVFEGGTPGNGDGPIGNVARHLPLASVVELPRTGGR